MLKNNTIMKTIEGYTVQFKQYLQQLGYSKSSVYMLPVCVADFLKYNSTVAPQELTQQHIDAFYNYLHIRPHKHNTGALSDSYIYHHVYALKLFFNYLEHTEQITCNPMSAMSFKRPKICTREPLSTQEINRLFETAQTRKETAMLHLFYSCGLRRSEAVALNTQDIHFSQHLLYVRQGKGHKRRVIPMTPGVSRALQQYWEQETVHNQNKELEQDPKRSTDAFMVNTNGQRMRGDSYNRIIKHLVEKADIQRPCTLHHLRHSIATHLLENGLSLENVRDFLGHSHLEATQIYTKVGTFKLREL